MRSASSSAKGSAAALAVGDAEAVFQLLHAGGKRDESIGERILDVVRIGDEHALAVAIDDVRGHADDGGVGRHVGQHHRAGADAGVFADGDVAEDVGVVADEDAVADGGVALAVALAGAAQRDALVHGHVAAHDGGFADHHAGGVIDEQAPAEQRAGMDVDAGEEAAHLRENARRQAQVVAPEPVRNAMNPHRPKARIAEQHFEPRARSRIALHHGADVFANSCKPET